MKHLLFMTLPAIIFTTCAHADDRVARDWATGCIACHGTGKQQGTIPSLTGRERSAIVAAMQEFRDGHRPAAIMHQIAKGYTPVQIEVIADYFSRQNPATE
ncbi:MAG: class I cytochrome c [Pseudomonadota bacterium]